MAVWAALISAAISYMGQDQMQGQLDSTGRKIEAAGRYQPGQVFGPFGSFAYDPWRAKKDGFVTYRPQESAANQNIRGIMDTMIPGLLTGGMYNSDVLQDAMSANNIVNPFNQAQGALQQQQMAEMFGNLQGSNQSLFNAGTAALQDTDMSGLVNQYIDSQRALAQPYQDRQFNRLQDRLFAQGRLDSSGGSRDLTNLLGEFSRLDNQNVLAGQQLGLNALQNNRAFGQSALQAAGGLEQQAFGQSLASLQQNQSAGNQRLQNAMGLFGFGRDTFGQQFGLGQQGMASMLSRDDFIMRQILGLMNAESGRIGALGLNNQALANLGGAGAAGTGSFFGNMASMFGGMSFS